MGRVLPGRLLSNGASSSLWLKGHNLGLSKVLLHHTNITMQALLGLQQTSF